ncbi:MAG TPA: hypothetical protein VLS89_14930, partial [Candidatus Nanopelagicales bacterium]|nr:hypothetical protein [Candidatus Nanopelagicales bacterium]
MRILTRHSRDELRLGWLRIVARLAVDRDVGSPELISDVRQLAAGRYDGWIAAAGLEIEPRGPFSEEVVPRLVAMASRFGVYDPDRQSLTDLGRTLAEAERLVPGAVDGSPFEWPLPLRYIGLRVLLGADGDLTTEILRGFPEGALRSPRQLIAEIAAKLVERAMEPEGLLELKRLAAHTKNRDDRQREYNQTVYPLLEPLRELGYLTRLRQERAVRYVLTPAGAHLRAALRRDDDDTDATVLLKQRFSRMFIEAELSGREIDMAHPGLTEIRATLLGLPRSLLGATGFEAPLEPVVLLTQVRLLRDRPGAWVELAPTADLLGELARVTEGRIGLKAG